MSDRVVKIYVIRRKLEDIPEYIMTSPKINNKYLQDHLCHSGLLIETEKKNYFILEYGFNGKNKVELRKIEMQQLNIIDGDSKWTIDLNALLFDSTEINVKKIKKIMKKQMKGKKYDMLSWNCHMAQQKTLSTLGINIEEPYNVTKMISLFFL